MPLFRFDEGEGIEDDEHGKLFPSSKVTNC